MSDTKIEWTDATWNPIAGCSVVSPGCANCYAMKMAARLEKMSLAATYDGLTQTSKAGPVWTGRVNMAPEARLLEPLRRKKPTRYFVNSMSDLFHENVADEWIDRIFAVMALSPQHTFQILTKRSRRMREYLDDFRTPRRIAENCLIAGRNLPEGHAGFARKRWVVCPDGSVVPAQWPLPNVWLGVSAEDQTRYDERKDDLRATPSALRFFSFEPLLGPIVGDWFGDWAIVGGESGAHARPMHPQWASDIREQCASARVAFFFKQWGEWTSGENAADVYGTLEAAWWFNGAWRRRRVTERESEEMTYEDGPDSWCVGKRRAGRVLDGVEHNAFPEPRT